MRFIVVKEMLEARDNEDMLYPSVQPLPLLLACMPYPLTLYSFSTTVTD